MTRSLLWIALTPEIIFYFILINLCVGRGWGRGLRACVWSIEVAYLFTSSLEGIDKHSLTTVKWTSFQTEHGAVVCHFSVHPSHYRPCTVSLFASWYEHLIPASGVNNFVHLLLLGNDLHFKWCKLLYFKAIQKFIKNSNRFYSTCLFFFCISEQ